MRLGRLFQLWRRREALTLRAAAAKIGINPSTLGRIERGESMHADTLTTLLVWLMGREEPSANEAFTFEAKDAVAVDQDQVAERNTTPAGELSSNTCKFGGEEAGAGESSSNTCELRGGDRVASGGPEDVTGGRAWTGFLTEDSKANGAEVEEEPEEAAELSVHAVDQDAALCGVREERGGGGSHGAEGAGAEGAG